MAERLGVDIVLRKIADLDITTDRGVAVPEGTLTTDAASVISDDSIAIVVETIGGTGIAKKLKRRFGRHGTLGLRCRYSSVPSWSV